MRNAYESEKFSQVKVLVGDLRCDQTEMYDHFIRSNADRHITHESLSYFQHPKQPGILVVGLVGNDIAGISGARFFENTVRNSITVVSKYHRYQGLGAILLAEKIRIASDRVWEALVAADNHTSRRICQKVGMQRVGISWGERGDDEYQIIHYGFPSKERTTSGLRSS